MSLRGRLLLVLGVVALVALGVADVVVYSQFRSFLLAQLDQNLQAAHHSFEDALQHNVIYCGPGGVVSGEGGSGGPGGGIPGAQGYFAELRCPNGTSGVVQSLYPFGSSESESPQLPAALSGFSSTKNPGGEPVVYFDAGSTDEGDTEFHVRAGVYRNGDELILATPLTQTNTSLHRLLLIELGVSGAALLLVGVSGWWLVRLGLRPLRDIERTAGAIAGGDLSHRVPGENPTTEVGRLARALNVMLGRIQDAFAARDTTEGELRRSEGRMRQFVADASHELRTPLSAVSAYAELFERGARRKPEDLGRVMSGIRGETARMGRLVEDLLLLARMDEGRPVERQRVELVAVAAEAVAAQAVGPDWPVTLAAGEPVEVLGDRERLRQVFDNLLSNVRSHTPPGTAATVRVAREGDVVLAEVADNGPGLVKDDASRVFERFYRSDPSRTRASGGTGLGLSIVAAIVEAHGGSVAAANGPDGGAVFGFRLPAA